MSARVFRRGRVRRLEETRPGFPAVYWNTALPASFRFCPTALKNLLACFKVLSVW